MVKVCALEVQDTEVRKALQIKVRTLGLLQMRDGKSLENFEQSSGTIFSLESLLYYLLPRLDEEHILPRGKFKSRETNSEHFVIPKQETGTRRLEAEMI